MARQLALQRCDEMETREQLREAIRQETSARQQEAERFEDLRRAQAARSLEAQARTVRANPRVPELGATAEESAALCQRQGGQHSQKRFGDSLDTTYICQLGGIPIYIALKPVGAIGFSAVKAFYEDADIQSYRGKLEDELGAPDRETVERGFRAWIWIRGSPQVDLRSYQRGVALTIRRSETRPPDESVQGGKYGTD